MMTLTAKYCCALSFPQVSALLSGFLLNYSFIIFWPGAIKLSIKLKGLVSYPYRSNFYQ